MKSNISNPAEEIKRLEAQIQVLKAEGALNMVKQFEAALKKAKKALVA